MNQFKRLVTQLLIVTALLLPWSPAGAVETFKKAGVLNSLGSSTFTIRNTEYRIAPGATLDSNDPGRKRFSDFRKGDEIYIEGKLLNGVHFVDKIVYRTPLPS
jgi:hypothetical protein